MIISLLGPDGVGKSTIIDAMPKFRWYAFSGSHIEEWPDHSWYDEFVAKGIDELALDDDEHFKEKIRRIYRLANDLTQDYDYVIIDSDNLHKTLIYDYLRLMPDVDKAKQRLHARYSELMALLPEFHEPVVYVYLQVSDSLDEYQQAKILQDRVSSRGKLKPFDPTTVDSSLNRLRACRLIKKQLIENHQKVITVTTDKPIDFAAFKAELDNA